MGNTKKDKAAEAAALLQKKYEDALDAYNGLPSDVTDEIKTAAQELLDVCKAALDAEPDDEKLVKVRALLSLAGKYLLSHDPGTEFEIAEKQAAEIVESKYGEYVK